jgi:gliding motility-associated-like protein
LVFRVYGGTYPYQYSSTGGAPYQSNDTIILPPGTYTPAIIDNNNCSEVLAPVTINAAPLPGTFTADVTNICSRDTVTFTRVGPGVIYRWEFGDGQFTTSSINPMEHRYINSTGATVIYTVEAFATSGAPNYCIDSSEMDITVNPEPVIDFFASPDTVYFPDPTITITNNSVAGYTGYIWDFGDGSPVSNLEDPGTHTYLDCGEYFIIAYAELGACSGFAEDTVFVTAYEPIAALDVDTTQYCLSALEDYGYTFNFTNLSQNYESFEWIFYDNTADTIRDTENISLNPGDVGDFTVYLDVYGYCGLFDSNDTTLTVHQSPIVDFEFAPDTVLLPNSPIHCYNLSSSDSRDFFWEFGDGGTSEEENPIWYYSEEGSYLIQLTVTSENNCVDSLTLGTEVVVLPAGEIIFPNAFSPNGDGNNDTFTAGVYQSVEWFKLEIYNRWGERMFTTNDIARGWDGYFDGKLALQDVYVWRAEGVFLNGMPFELAGSVTLIR